MPASKSWRVRVKRAMEDWVEVQADSPQEAEAKALHLPGVLSVFSRMTIRADMRVDVARPVGVEE